MYEGTNEEYQIPNNKYKNLLDNEQWINGKDLLCRQFLCIGFFSPSSATFFFVFFLVLLEQAVAVAWLGVCIVMLDVDEVVLMRRPE